MKDANNGHTSTYLEQTAFLVPNSTNTAQKHYSLRTSKR